MDELRLILLGIGIIIIVMIYLWGMRNRIRQGLSTRRRRRSRVHSPENEPVLGDGQVLPDPDELSKDAETKYDGVFSSDDPFADQRLVDVEIRPVNRSGDKSTEPVSEESVEIPAQPLPSQTPAVTEEPHVAATEEPHVQEEKMESEITVLLTVIASKERRFKGVEILEAAQELGLKLNRNGTLDYLASGEELNSPIFSIAHLREPGIFNQKNVSSLSTPGLLLFMHLPGPVEGVASMDLMIETARGLAEKLGGTVGDEHRKEITPEGMMQLRSRVIEFAEQQKRRPLQEIR